MQVQRHRSPEFFLRESSEHFQQVECSYAFSVLPKISDLCTLVVYSSAQDISAVPFFRAAGRPTVPRAAWPGMWTAGELSGSADNNGKIGKKKMIGRGVAV